MANRRNTFVFIFGLLWIFAQSQSVYKGPRGGNINLNPYTMQYLKQMLARGGYSQAPKQHTQVPNNLKIKALSLNPGMKPSNLKVKPISVNPQLIKALYGSTFIKPSTGNADAGKYSYAQINPQSTVKQSASAKYNPVVLTVPNLGSMLYQYAKQQEITQKQSPNPSSSLNQNLYKMFGQMTYGPMPKPSNFPSSAGYGQARIPSSHYQPTKTMSSAYSQQASRPTSAFSSYTQQNSYGGSNYRSQPTSRTGPQLSQSSYQPAPVQQQSYQQPTYSAQQQNNGYGGNTFTAPSYGSSQKQQQSSGYEAATPLKAWGGSIHISGTADGFDTPSFTGYKSPVSVMASGYGQQNTQRSGYGQQSSSSGYGSALSKSFIGAGTTCSNVSPGFCQNKKAGHYSHPNNKHCFMQCDAFGRGYDKECAPGTAWRGRGSEPAYYNMCS